MKPAKILFITLIGCVLFCACDSKDDPTEPEENPWFKGKMNGQLISADKNSTYNGFAAWNPLPDGTYKLDFNRTITDTEYSLHMYLRGLKEHIPSTHLINTDIWNEKEEGCCIKKNKGNEVIAVYSPSETLCTIRIEKFEYKTEAGADLQIPRLSGTIEGVFYNTKDPDDSIIVKEAKFIID